MNGKTIAGSIGGDYSADNRTRTGFFGRHRRQETMMLNLKLTAAFAIAVVTLAGGIAEAKAPRSLSCSSLGWMGGNAKDLQIANLDETGSLVRAGTTLTWVMSP